MKKYKLMNYWVFVVETTVIFISIIIVAIVTILRQATRHSRSTAIL